MRAPSHTVALGLALLLLAAAGAAEVPRPAAPKRSCRAGAAARGRCLAKAGPLLLQRRRLRGSSALGAALANATDEDGAAPAGSAVERYGFLEVEGNRTISNKTGLPVRLRGMSLFWSQWMPQFYTNETVFWLRDDWNATLVRAAMGIEEGGYLENPEVEKAKVRSVVDAAIAAGIYVIIDWHDHHAERHLSNATDFFREMAEMYGKHPNVMYEVFNEPTDQQDWGTTIKPYHEQLVGVIRQHSSSPIILGTPFWSTDAAKAALDPVKGKNLAYTLHFYAATSGQPHRDKTRQAIASGIALFATEWGACDTYGDGILDLAEAQAWLAFLERHGISDANWAVSDKAEACSALTPGASGLGGWEASNLTESGAFVRAALREEGAGVAPNSTATERPEGPVVP